MLHEDKKRILYGWYIVTVTFLILSLSYGIRWSFGIFYNSMAEDFGLNRTMFSLLMSTHMLVFAAGSPIIGLLSDRYDTKYILLFGTIILGSGFIFLSYSNKLWNLYFLYGIWTAIGSCGTGLVPNNLVVASWFKNRRGISIGISGTGTSIGPLFIAPLSTYLLLQYGWRSTFLILGSIILIVLVPTILFLIKNLPNDNSLDLNGQQRQLASTIQINSNNYGIVPKKFYLKEIMNNSIFWTIIFSYFAFSFSYYLVVFHLPIFSLDRGISEMTAAKVLGVTTASGIFGKLLVGLISDKIGRRYPLIIVLFIQTVSLLGFMYGETLETFYISGICLGFSFGGSITLFPLITAEFFRKGTMGKTFGIITLGGSIGASVGPFVGGAAFDLAKSYFPALLVGALISVLALGKLVLRPFPKKLE